MAASSYGTATQRPATTSLPSNDGESKNPTKKYTIPSDPESATVIIIGNLGKFSSHYALLMWGVLFVTLALNGYVSLTYFLAVTKVALLHFGLLLILPEFVVLHKNATDKRLVLVFLLFMLFLLFVGTALELILPGGEMFLLLAFVAVVAVVLLHAVISRGEDRLLNEEQEEMAFVVQEKGSGDQSENVV